MNSLRELTPDVARQASNSGRSDVRQDDLRRDYLHIELCPCCGIPAANARPRIASAPPAETLGPERHTSFVSGYTQGRVFFTYFECPNCSAMFCPTYYRQASSMGFTVVRPRTCFTCRSRRANAPSRTTSIFCAGTAGWRGISWRSVRISAYLLRRSGGWARSIGFWLYEPNRDVHGPLAENFRGMRHTISTGIFRAADVPAQSVSTAVMIHVLDHLLEPAQFLREIASSMEPDGVIFIVTHDCASLLARVLRGRWPPYALQHPQLFSERSIARLLQASGFEVLETVKTTNYFPLPYLICAALTVCGLPAGFIPAGTAPLVAIKLGNIATIARKLRA